MILEQKDRITTPKLLVFVTSLLTNATSVNDSIATVGTTIVIA